LQLSRPFSVNIQNISERTSMVRFDPVQPK